MVNYEDSIKKPFTDVGKLIIGILVSFIPLVNWIAKGFIIESSGMGKTRPSKKMPEWKDWASLFFKGFASYVIAFIYALPAIILFVASIGIVAASLSGSVGTMVQDGLISSIVSGDMSSGLLRQFISQNFYAILPALIAVAPILLIGAILLLIAVYLTPVAVLNYLKTRKFSKAFDINFVLSKACTMKYLTVWIVAGIISLIATVLLSLIPLIGAQTAFFVSGVISYSLYGNVLREIKNKK